jgi:hypothetical protein
VTVRFFETGCGDVATFVTSVNDLLCATCEPPTDENPAGEWNEVLSGRSLSPHPARTKATTAMARQIFIDAQTLSATRCMASMDPVSAAAHGFVRARSVYMARSLRAPLHDDV